MWIPVRIPATSKTLSLIYTNYLFLTTLYLDVCNTGMENGASSEGRDPSGFLNEIIGAPVTVKLNSGVVYKGLF